jgi:hypothetical protein
MKRATRGAEGFIWRNMAQCPDLSRSLSRSPLARIDHDFHLQHMPGLGTSAPILLHPDRGRTTSRPAK